MIVIPNTNLSRRPNMVLDVVLVGLIPNGLGKDETEDFTHLGGRETTMECEGNSDEMLTGNDIRNLRHHCIFLMQIIRIHNG
jgi:hypothetical protein